MESNTEDRKWKVYIHTNKINQKRYVGITQQKNPEDRWRNGRGYEHNAHFKSAIKKYGWDNFDHRVIFNDLTECEAKDLEVRLIQILRTQSNQYGYNITKGGDGRSCVSSKCVPIYQFTKDGDFIKEFQSITNAAKEVGGRTGSIIECCQEKQASAYGFCWKYKNKCNDLARAKEEILERANKLHKARSISGKKEAKNLSHSKGEKGIYICQFALNGKFVASYRNAMVPARKFNYDCNDIRRSCRGERPSAYGYIWKNMADCKLQKDGTYKLIDNVSHRKYEKVYQFKEDYTFVREYARAQDAAKATGIKSQLIVGACNAYCMSNGFIWRHEDGVEKSADGTIRPIFKHEQRHVIQLTKNSEFIKEYDNAKIASLDTGIKANRIRCACWDKRTSHGFKWMWADEYNRIKEEVRNEKEA